MAERKYWFYERGEGNSPVKPLTLTALMTSRPTLLKPTDLIMDAMKIIQEQRIRHIPIVSDGDGRLVGLVTETDILKNVLHGKSMTPDEQYHATLDMLLPLERIMVRDVYTLPADAPVVEAVEAVIKRRIRCIPVLDGASQVVGIVTETDLMQLLEHVIEQ
jgi:CBS domain-containing protein